MKNLKDLTPKQTKALMKFAADLLPSFMVIDSAFAISENLDINEIEEFKELSDCFIKFTNNLIEAHEHKKENHFKTTNQENPTPKNN